MQAQSGFDNLGDGFSGSGRVGTEAPGSSASLKTNPAWDYYPWDLAANATGC